jgi:hypothetical protein
MAISDPRGARIVAELTIQQQRALALARARARAAQEGVAITPVPTLADKRGLPGQFMSGMTEGAANLLSLPNTLELGLRSIGPAIGNAVGGDFAMPTESVLPDAGQRLRDFAENAGSMTPATEDGVGKFTRRIGQEVGAGLIPALGVVSRAATPVRMALAETAALTGSGAGAAVAQEVFPGNPTAEMVGQLLGGFTPVGLINQAERMAMKTRAPSLDDLRANKSAAYSTVDNLGVQYTPQAMDDLVTQMTVAGARINPMRHPKAASMLEEIKGLSGKSPTLTELDELRQTIARDLIKSSDGAERFWGFQFNNTLDDFIAKAKPGHMVSGDPVTANTAINNARDLNTRYRKTEDFERQMNKATNQASSTGSGGNINNAIRQKARQILDDPKRTRAYSAEELEALKKLVAQGKGEDFLRGAGKMAPGGNGLMTGLNVAAVIHNPQLLAIPAVAQTAKFMADRGTTNQAKVLRALLAKGNATPVPAITANTEKVIQSLMTAQAANNNVPNQQVLEALLRVKGLN